jgi:tetratricopeptide (TPR) repeat protein
LKLEDAKKEVAYQNAISLFESEKYAEAIAAFSELEYYKDSHDKIQEVITAGIAKAEALANAGYYEAAYSLTQELYHDDFRNLVYSISKMCAYAKDFDFASAVEYGLKNVILPEEIEVIPARYFEGSDVESVVLPTTLKQIGEAAFKNCKHIKEIYLPHGLLTIEKNAFYGCTSLEKIEFSDTVTTIKDYAFRGCKKLTVVEIGNSVVSIGAKAFASCSNLASVTIPESVTGIASEAFLDCNKLVEVINHSRIPLTAGDSGNGYTAYYAIEVHTGESKLIEQDEYLFYSYDKINYLVGYAGKDTVLTLPDGYNGEKYVINDHAFQGESSITEVIISDFATAIGDYAFESCDGVRTLTVGNSVTHIGKYAFYDCTSIESLTLGDSVVSIGERAFQNCKNDHNLYVLLFNFGR